jgi:membrane protease YdiL (CAAX protease family)
MELSSVQSGVQPQRESTSLASRFALVVFCLAAGFAYRFLVGLLAPSILQSGVLLGLAILFLILAVITRRQEHLSKYWQIPFAFFIFTIAGILGDQSGFIQQMFVRNVLHQSPSANNPFASTVMGTVLAQLVSTASLVIPILLLTKASGADMKSIFIAKTRNWWTLVVGIIGFLAYYRFTESGRAERFFPNNGVTQAHFLALTPALIVLVLCNGLREELWFRGLFLNKYGKFLSPLASNMLSAIIFASFHVQVKYTPALAPFLVIALILGLLFGYLMQKSGSILASMIFHAGSDIPIFLVYLSYASP